VKVFDMIANLADTPTEEQKVRYSRGIAFLSSNR
jgi:hypothetical protein